MSSAKITVSNFALENHCEPCQFGGEMGRHTAGASLVGGGHHGFSTQPQQAIIVSSRPPQSMYETQVNRMIQTLNASNLGSLPQHQAKANLTGYHSGFATF